MKPRRKRLALALLVAASVVAAASIGRIAIASSAAVDKASSPAATLQDDLAQVRQATALP